MNTERDCILDLLAALAGLVVLMLVIRANIVPRWQAVAAFAGVVAFVVTLALVSQYIDRR